MAKSKSTLLHRQPHLETLISHTLLPAGGDISEFDFLIYSQNTNTSPFVAKHFIQGIENQYRTHKKETPKFRVSFLFQPEDLTDKFTRREEKHPPIAMLLNLISKGGTYT